MAGADDNDIKSNHGASIATMGTMFHVELFADAELREDAIEDVINFDAARDATKRVRGTAEVLCAQDVVSSTCCTPNCVGSVGEGGTVTSMAKQRWFAGSSDTLRPFGQSFAKRRHAFACQR